MNIFDRIISGLYPVLPNGTEIVPVVQSGKFVAMPFGFVGGNNARKTADQAVSATSALTADTELFFNIKANEEWICSWSINAGDNIGTNGLNIGVSVSGVSAMAFNVAINPDVTIAGNKNYQTTTVSGTKLVFNPVDLSGVAKCGIYACGWFIGGTTDNVVKLKWSPTSVGGTPVVFRKGSFMTAIRMA